MLGVVSSSRAGSSNNNSIEIGGAIYSTNCQFNLSNSIIRENSGFLEPVDELDPNQELEFNSIYGFK